MKFMNLETVLACIVFDTLEGKLMELLTDGLILRLAGHFDCNWRNYYGAPPLQINPP
jgi:hypothetical protein